MRRGSVTVRPKPGMNAELREVRGETRFGRHDAKVRHEREAETAADRRPLNRADHRLLATEQTNGLAIQLAGGVAEPFLCKLRASRPVAPTASEVRPRTERFALGRQYDGPALRVFVHCGKCIGDLADQTEVEEVVRRTLNLDGGDVTVERHADVGEAYGAGMVAAPYVRWSVECCERIGRQC